MTDPENTHEATETPKFRPARSGGRNARRRSREFAVQGLYQRFLTNADLGVILAGLIGSPGYKKSDSSHLEALLQGVIREQSVYEQMVSPHLDREMHLVSPVERAILLIGAYELKNHPEIPFRVVINEAVDLAKVFGGTDGFKFVNGVLDRVAADCGVADGRR